MNNDKKAVVTNKKQLNTPAHHHKTPETTRTNMETNAKNTSFSPVDPQITSENTLQAYLFKWAWNTYPESRRHIWAVPNGAKRSRYEQNLMKSTGLISGVYDLHCFWNGKFYAFELKYGKNKQSEEQSQWGEQMRQHGATVYEIRETDVDRWKEIISGIFGIMDIAVVIVKEDRTAKPAAAIPRAQDGNDYDGNRSAAQAAQPDNESAQMDNDIF